MSIRLIHLSQGQLTGVTLMDNQPILQNGGLILRQCHGFSSREYRILHALLLSDDPLVCRAGIVRMYEYSDPAPGACFVKCGIGYDNSKTSIISALHFGHMLSRFFKLVVLPHVHQHGVKHQPIIVYLNR